MKQTNMPAPLHITEHALLRYLERVRGFSFAKERAEIMKICKGTTNGTVKAVGHQFEIRNGRLLTITPPGVCAQKRSDTLARLEGK